MLALVSCFGLRQRSRTIREPACRRVVILRQRYVNQHVIIVVRCGKADEKVRAGKATPGTPSRTLLVCTERRKGWVVAGPGVDLCMCQVKGCRHVHSRVRVVACQRPMIRVWRTGGRFGPRLPMPSMPHREGFSKGCDRRSVPARITTLFMHNLFCAVICLCNATRAAPRSGSAV